MAVAGHHLTPERVIPAALQAGALTAADVLVAGVTVDPVGRSHAVYRVSIANEPRFYVKSFGPRRGATDGLAACEREVSALAECRPTLAALVPPAWPWHPPPADGDELEIVATEAIRGVEAWQLDQIADEPLSVDAAWQMVVDAIVAPLAALHRATRDLAASGAGVGSCLHSTEPWGLRAMDGDAAPELWETEVTASLLREAATDAGLVAGLRSGRALWRPLALIHADLKHDNILCQTRRDGLRVRVIDWEMARIGDPAWDLATLASWLLVARGADPPWSSADIDAIAAMAGQYARYSGLAVPGLAQRLVHYSGARLLMMALQHESAAPGGGGSSRQLLMRARATFARAPGLIAAISAHTAEAA